ncbi:MAG: choice-of-anchor N protein [Proteobacteria bacterium]|nr:choice-of-anchor N protein [Pseudomonadota bacterium]MBU4287524.1 choice-of-anchor N protein [Pseudomonadota bacterium]MCG2757897.1 choice-of-anchor N protein [Desulfobacteraceae bacterium]
MRFLKGIIISTVMIGILLGFSLESSAVPNLQIYIPGATYEDETWVIDKYDFELWVIGANDILEDVKFAAAVPTNQDGSIEVTWIDNGSGNSYPDYAPAGNNTLTFSESLVDRVGTQYDYPYYLNYLHNISISTADPKPTPDPTSYGFGDSIDDYPLYAEGDDTHIPEGGIFPTDFYEYYIGGFVPTAFDKDTNPVYNYDPDEGFDPVTEIGTDFKSGMIKKFSIKVNGYTMVDFVAYGYYLNTSKKRCSTLNNTINPYSHGGAMVVPEPATLFLLGTGMIGLGWFGKRKTRKEKNR